MTQLAAARSIYELIARQFNVEGVSVVENRTATDIDIADKEIALNNPRRLALIVINLSSNAIYLRPLQAATSSAGIRIAANGGSFVSDWRDDLVLPALSWHGIAGGDNSAALILEIELGA